MLELCPSVLRLTLTSSYTWLVISISLCSGFLPFGITGILGFQMFHVWAHPTLPCLPAVASAWRCVSVSCHMTLRGSSCVWPAGTCGERRPLARPSSPRTPWPRWPCCRWTPAASPPSSQPRKKSNWGRRLLEDSRTVLFPENTNDSSTLGTICTRPSFYKLFSVRPHLPLVTFTAPNNQSCKLSSLQMKWDNKTVTSLQQMNKWETLFSRILILHFSENLFWCPYKDVWVQN